MTSVLWTRIWTLLWLAENYDELMAVFLLMIICRLNVPVENHDLWLFPPCLFNLTIASYPSSVHQAVKNLVKQSNLETALVSINKHICKVNQENNMSTPYCHTAIRKRKGKHPRYYYKHAYDLLWDGVHGTDTTRDKWAEAIQGAIRTNRGKRKTPDTEDEQKSPKCSWGREKKMAQS